MYVCMYVCDVYNENVLVTGADEINAAFIQPETVEKDLFLRELCRNISSVAIARYGTAISIHTHTYIHTCIHTYIHIYIAYIHTYIHRIHTYIHTYIVFCYF